MDEPRPRGFRANHAKHCRKIAWVARLTRPRRDRTLRWVGRQTRTAKRHPHRGVELAIRHALDHGWELVGARNESTGTRTRDGSMAVGQLISPTGRQLSIPASPRGGSRLAETIRAEVALLRHQRDTEVHREAVSMKLRHPPSATRNAGASDKTADADRENTGESTSENALVLAAFKRLSDELLHALADDPKLLCGLHWRDFEELVADLLSREGLEVSLTPGSRDRGVDIYARHYGPMGATLYVVERKRYGPDKPVGPDLVRLLYGVVERERATKGLLVTSSYFTVEAEREAREELAYRLALRDGAAVSEWIRGSTTRPAMVA